MGLDVQIYMVRNHKQLQEENFWNKCNTGWVKNKETDEIDFTQPSIVYYARKFWDLYDSAAKRFDIGNGEFSRPLTEEDIEFLIDIAIHNPDYYESFNTVPALCEILYHYYEIKNAGMILVFEGDY